MFRTLNWHTKNDDYCLSFLWDDELKKWAYPSICKSNSAGLDEFFADAPEWISIDLYAELQNYINSEDGDMFYRNSPILENLDPLCLEDLYEILSDALLNTEEYNLSWTC